MRVWKFRRAVCAALFGLMTAAAAFAQDSTGAIEGAVADTTAAVVPGARSVIVTGTVYNTDRPYSILDGQAGPDLANLETAAPVSHGDERALIARDRKSTRLNSSHMSESRMPSSA